MPPTGRQKKRLMPGQAPHGGIRAKRKGGSPPFPARSRKRIFPDTSVRKCITCFPQRPMQFAPARPSPPSCVRLLQKSRTPSGRLNIFSAPKALQETTKKRKTTGALLRLHAFAFSSSRFLALRSFVFSNCLFYRSSRHLSRRRSAFFPRFFFSLDKKRVPCLRQMKHDRTVYVKAHGENQNHALDRSNPLAAAQRKKTQHGHKVDQIPRAELPAAKRLVQ